MISVSKLAVDIAKTNRLLYINCIAIQMNILMKNIKCNGYNQGNVLITLGHIFAWCVNSGWANHVFGLREPWDIDN